MIITIKKRNFKIISFGMFLIVGAIIYSIGARKIDNIEIIKVNSNPVINKTVVLDARASVNQTGRSCKCKRSK